LLTATGIVALLVAGTAFADIMCSGGECSGTSMADRIVGSLSSDHISAEGGNDRVFARGADDLVKGEGGNDEINGQAGKDKLKGGPGGDAIFGGVGNDIMREGSHTLVDDGFSDTLDCGDGTDTVYYTPGVDEIEDCEILNPSQ